MNRRLGDKKESIRSSHDLEDKIMEINQSELQKEKQILKK